MLIVCIFYYLAPSAPFCIYCEYLEPLTHVFAYLQDDNGGNGNGNEAHHKKFAIQVRLTTAWTREYQVLPQRTHPHMNMTQNGGFLLTGTKLHDVHGRHELDPQVLARIRATLPTRRGKKRSAPAPSTEESAAAAAAATPAASSSNQNDQTNSSCRGNSSTTATAGERAMTSTTATPTSIASDQNVLAEANEQVEMTNPFMFGSGIQATTTEPEGLEQNEEAATVEAPLPQQSQDESQEGPYQELLLLQTTTVQDHEDDDQFWQAQQQQQPDTTTSVPYQEEVADATREITITNNQNTLLLMGKKRKTPRKCQTPIRLPTESSVEQEEEDDMDERYRQHHHHHKTIPWDDHHDLPPDGCHSWLTLPTNVSSNRSSQEADAKEGPCLEGLRRSSRQQQQQQQQGQPRRRRRREICIIYGEEKEALFFSKKRRKQAQPKQRPVEAAQYDHSSVVSVPSDEN
ncbi:hypothetical protein ACA910_009533 [Epithemia clementina (nom. ined.)]